MMAGLTRLVEPGVPVELNTEAGNPFRCVLAPHVYPLGFDQVLGDTRDG